MKWRQITIVFGLLLSVLGCGKESEVVEYSCPDEQSANACSNACSNAADDPKTTYRFKINPTEKSVLKVVYEDGVKVASWVDKNCTIFDEKNWDCTS